MPFLPLSSQQDSNYCIWDANNESVLPSSFLEDSDTEVSLSILRNAGLGCTVLH